MNVEQFKQELKSLKIILTPLQAKQLELYYELLVEWNQKINLTAIIEKDQVYLKHFYDSVTLTHIANFKENATLCDIGSGAGFPGIVLKIIFPHLDITLVDSLQKRIKFLNIVIKKLELQNIKAIHSRIEEYGKIKREHYDYVTARAVAHFSLILEYGIPLLKVSGKLLLMKANVEQEINESIHALTILNCKIEKQEEFSLPFGAGHRTLICVSKEKPTSKNYPRKYSEIKKKKL